MATTVKQSFRDYLSNLEITNRQQTKVSNSRQNVTDAIANELTLHPERSKVIGSWDRHTLTRYLSEADVDVMVILHYGKNKAWDTSDGVSEALKEVKRILKAKYSDTTIGIDNNCVTMKLSEFRLDVVPAFKFTNSTSGDYYKIPDIDRGMWIPTNPFAFADLMSSVNSNMDGCFKPLIKMVKGWNRDEGWPIKSFHLESMMYHRYHGYDESYTYSSMLTLFFEALPGYINSVCYDPIMNDRLDEYHNVNGKLAAAIKKAETAANLSRRALNLEDSNPAEAIRIWKVLLGDFFPAYG